MISPDLIILVTDSITNSVFESQLLIPLSAKNQHKNITVISLERIKIELKLEILKEQYPKVNFLIIKKRLPYLGKAFLLSDILRIKLILKKIKNYSIIARGPLAGYISKKVINKNCKELKIQARGLLECEYEHSNKNSYWLKKPLIYLRKKLFKSLEKATYTKFKPNNFYRISKPSIKRLFIQNI